MATSKTTNTYNRQNWEDAEFPILCQTCLGDNPYLRMTKEKYGKECKICSRPFTVFRWCPGARMRFKKTEVCQTCSRLKNVCQTCLLDLEYGLPIQVRDAALRVQDELPRSDVNKEYYIQNMDSQMSSWEPGQVAGGSGAASGGGGRSAAAGELLLKLARTAPYYKRNRPHVCSFWVKGECRRGEECPYRHERPTDPDDPLADQNIKDRYYGVNDPVAEKLMRRAAAMPAMPPPEDRSITTLYVGNLATGICEETLRNSFYQYGEIRSLTLVPRAQCGFVQFTTRAAAEHAAEKTFNKLVIQGRRLTIKWGKSQGRIGVDKPEQAIHVLEPVPGLPGALPPPPGAVGGAPLMGAGGQRALPGLPSLPSLPAPPAPPDDFFNLHRPQGGVGAGVPVGAGAGAPWPAWRPPPLALHYPSQDPDRMGSMKHHHQ